MKQIKKRLIAGFLALLLSCTCVFGNYHTVQAFAVEMTLLQLIEALLASAGATYMTHDIITNGFPTSRPVTVVDDLPYIPEDEVEDLKRAYESMNEAWDKQWEEKYGGGGGSDDNKPPKFNEFIRDTLSKGVVEYDENTWDLIKNWYETFMNDAYGVGQVAADKLLKDKGINVDMDYVTADTALIIRFVNLGWYGSYRFDTIVASSSFRDYTCFYLEGETICALSPYDGAMHYFKDGVYLATQNRFGYDYVSRDSTFPAGIEIYKHWTQSKYLNYMIGSCPTFDNYEDAKAYIIEQFNSGSTVEEKITKPPIMVVPALQDSMNNTGTYTLPQEVPQPVSIPTIEQLESLRQQLADEDTKPDTAVENYIEQLKTDTEPTVVPTITVAPTITVTPAPDGDDTDNNDFIADLKEIFPFCVPFDLVRAFKLLTATPEAPVFSIPFKVDAFSFHVDEKWEVDMSDYEPVIKIFRVLETIGFVVGLVLITRKLIKG